MDFDGAIQAHTYWKVRLLLYARGKAAEKIDLQTLRKDNVCALGQWLHGDAQRYSGDPKFKKLLETHAAFHKAAASVGSMIERGQAPAAEALLNFPGSEYSRLSSTVLAILMDLRKVHLAA